MSRPFLVGRFEKIEPERSYNGDGRLWESRAPSVSDGETEPGEVVSTASVHSDDSDSGELEGDCPEPRSGHRVVVDEGNLYSLGGYNPLFWEVDNSEDTCYPLFRELWRFNFATRRWSEVECSGPMPRELASHSAILHEGRILVFGGTGVPFGQCSSNDLYEFSLLTRQWRHIPCTGDLPQKKYGHAMIIHGDNLYVIGGTTGYVYNASVHILHLPTSEWRSPDIEEQTAPSGRYRHELAFSGKHIYLLGGGTATTVIHFEQIPTFDLAEEEWITTRTRADPEHGYPPARRCHGCVQYQNRAYIIGGLANTEILGDVWCFCMSTHCWRRLAASMPLPAYFHSVAVSPEGCVSVFGGVVCLDTERTNHIYQIWIDVPSLKEMCWQTICRNTKHIGRLKRTELYQCGVPSQYLDRLS